MDSPIKAVIPSIETQLRINVTEILELSIKIKVFGVLRFHGRVKITM